MAGPRCTQLDNQLFGGLNPIVLYPTIVANPQTRDTEPQPTFHLAITQAKDTSYYGVDYYKYFSVLMQEMSLEIDEDFLFALLDFTKFNREECRRTSRWKARDSADS